MTYALFMQHPVVPLVCLTNNFSIYYIKWFFHQNIDCKLYKPSRGIKKPRRYNTQTTTSF